MLVKEGERSSQKVTGLGRIYVMTEEDRTRLLHMADAAQKAVTLVTGISL